jgi:hypothetical protein
MCSPLVWVLCCVCVVLVSRGEPLWQLREDLLREVLFRRARKCSADEPLSDSVDVIKGGGRTSFPDGLSPSTGLGSGMGTPVLPALFPALGTGAGAGMAMRSAANCAQCRPHHSFAVERACGECGVAWLVLCVAAGWC